MDYTHPVDRRHPSTVQIMSERKKLHGIKKNILPLIGSKRNDSLPGLIASKNNVSNQF